jgi:hypothetical protein
MRRIVPIVLTITLGTLGCLPVQVEKRPPQIEMRPPVEPPAVIADEVNEQNAGEKARALREEMLRETKQPAAVSEAVEKP